MRFQRDQEREKEEEPVRNFTLICPWLSICHLIFLCLLILTLTEKKNHQEAKSGRTPKKSIKISSLSSPTGLIAP